MRVNPFRIMISEYISLFENMGMYKLLRFGGDCKVIDDFLENKPIFSIKWFFPHFLNVLLRSVGQVRKFFKKDTIHRCERLLSKCVLRAKSLTTKIKCALLENDDRRMDTYRYLNRWSCLPETNFLS